MSLSLNQFSIITEQLKQENITEFIETLLLEYASDVKRTSYLLSLIPKLAENQLQIKNNEVIEQSLATNLLLGTTDKMKNIDFPTLMYTCKAVFPSGNCNGASSSGAKFFQKFIDAIKNKKGWDYESEEDWKWIKDIALCEYWMIEVIKQNIDENFGVNNNDL